MNKKNTNTIVGCTMLTMGIALIRSSFIFQNNEMHENKDYLELSKDSNEVYFVTIGEYNL